MYTRSLFVLSAVMLVGCNQQAAPDPSGALDESTPAVTTTPSEEQKPFKYEAVPLSIAAESIVPFEGAELANAAWTAKSCALTTPDDQPELKPAADGATRFEGYFVGPNDAPPGAFDIVLRSETSNYRIPVRSGWERADVGDFFKIPALNASGFQADVVLAPAVAVGRYKIDFVVDINGGKFFCESGKALVVG